MKQPITVTVTRENHNDGGGEAHDLVVTLTGACGAKARAMMPGGCDTFGALTLLAPQLEDALNSQRFENNDHTKWLDSVKSGKP